MERSELPGQERLQQLRELGAVPYSSFASGCFGAVFIVVGLYFLASPIKELIARWLVILNAEGLSWSNLPGGGSPASGSGLLLLFVVPAGVVLFVRILAAQLQTRFLFRMASLSLDLSRLNPLSGRGVSKLPGRLAIFVLQGVAGGLLSAVAVYALAPELFGLLNGNQGVLGKETAELALGILPVLLIGLLTAGFAGALFAQILFRFAHRVSRAEQEREQRN